MADDIYALYYNPAGIACLKKGGAAFTHYNYGLGDLPITFAAAAYRTKLGSFGVAVNNLDINSRFLGDELNSYERSLQLTYAHQLSAKVIVGGSVKWVRTSFEQPPGAPAASANALGLDIGILVQNLFPHWTFYRRNESFPPRFRKFDRQRFQGLSLGLALLNTGPDRLTYTDDSQGDPLPQILRLGVALNAVDTDEIGALLAVDLDKELVKRDGLGPPDGFVESWFTAWHDGFDHLRFGAEVNLFHVFAFRLGRDAYLNFNDGSGSNSVSEWTFGVGLGPEWARLNLVHRGFPVGFKEKWVADLVLSY